MEDIRTSWGETLPMTIEADDATTATLYIGNVSEPIVTSTASFVSGSADVSVSAEDMEIPPSDYSYQLVIEYTDGSIRKFPDASCKDCSLPTLTVCPTIDMPEES